MNATARARLLRAATNAAVAVALLLAAAKMTAFLFSGSVALLASALDSMLDASASLVNALAVRYALRPPDADHRFGHGKSEALAGAAQALFIAGSGVFVIVRAVLRLVHPEPLSAALPAVGVMVASLALTLGLITLQLRVVAHTRSTAIRADALHYATDVASNAATLLALLLARGGLERADPLFGLLIALMTLYGAWRIARDSLSMLMDQELPDSVRQEIERIARARAEVRGIHALRTRMSGATLLIQLHIELDPAITLAEANRIAHDVEAGIKAAFIDSDVTIHQDPVGQPCHQQGA